MNDLVRAYRVIVAVTLVVLGIGVVFYHIVEGFSWLNSYYFCVITLTTIGYGDFTPHTDLGKLFTTFYVLIGIGVITGFITITAKRQTIKIQHHYEKHHGYGKHHGKDSNARK